MTAATVAKTEVRDELVARIDSAYTRLLELSNVTPLASMIIMTTCA